MPDYEKEESILEYVKKGSEELAISYNTFLFIMIYNKLVEIESR